MGPSPSVHLHICHELIVFCALLKLLLIVRPLFVRFQPTAQW